MSEENTSETVAWEMVRTHAPTGKKIKGRPGIVLTNDDISSSERNFRKQAKKGVIRNGRNYSLKSELIRLSSHKRRMKEQREEVESKVDQFDAFLWQVPTKEGKFVNVNIIIEKFRELFYDFLTDEVKEAYEKKQKLKGEDEAREDV